MTIGIMSDSHDHMVLIRRAADMFRDAGVDTVIHAGDVNSPHAYFYLKDIGVPFYGVFGNNDMDREHLRAAFAPIGSFHPHLLTLTIGGLTIGVIHDDREAAALARDGEYDVIIHGHAHEADVHTINDTLVINPGEVCGWCSGRSTVAILDTRTREVTIHDLITPVA
jgi:putative phosphoesterase